MYLTYFFEIIMGWQKLKHGKYLDRISNKALTLVFNMEIIQILMGQKKARCILIH